MSKRDDDARAVLHVKVHGRRRYVLIEENKSQVERATRERNTMPPRASETINPREAAIHQVLQQLALGLQAALTANLPNVAIAVGKAIDEAKWELEALEADRPLNSGRPFTPETLSARWSCSAAHVRNLIKTGKLDGFWLGDQLLRIPAVEVRRFEKEGPKPPTQK